MRTYCRTELGDRMIESETSIRFPILLSIMIKMVKLEEIITEDKNGKL